MEIKTMKERENINIKLWW